MFISLRTIFLIAVLSPSLAQADLNEGLGASTIISPAVVADGSAWFLAKQYDRNETYLYRTNGTVAGTERVFTSEEMPGDPLPPPVARNGGIFFLSGKSGTIRLSRTDVAT